MDNNFEDLLNKCRCCFTYLSSASDEVEITDNHRELFLKLTNIELQTESIYSKYFCKNCDIEIRNFEVNPSFTMDAILKQSLMYEMRPSSLILKEEPIEVDKFEIFSQDNSHIDEFDGYNVETKIEIKECSVILERLFGFVYEDDYENVKSTFYELEESKSRIEKKSTKKQSGRSQRWRTCDLCGVQRESIRTFLDHMRSKHLKMRYQCDICGLKITSFTEIGNHIKLFHCPKNIDQLKCSFCGIICKSKSLLKSHVRIHTYLNCKLCHKSFKTEYFLNKHIKIDHENKKDGFECDICHKKFTLHHSLMCHKRHTHKKLIKCIFDGCKVMFSHNFVMKLHYDEVHLKIKVEVSFHFDIIIHNFYFILIYLTTEKLERM
jgi:hypothetical protein